jgi:hypothetical protein
MELLAADDLMVREHEPEPDEGFAEKERRDDAAQGEPAPESDPLQDVTQMTLCTPECDN